MKAVGLAFVRRCRDGVRMGKRIARGRLAKVQQFRLGVAEASGVAPLPDGRFLIVDDEIGLHLCTREGDARPLAPSIRGDLEGVCMAADGRTVYVLCERRGTVWQATLDDGQLRDVRTLGNLPDIGKRNRGWEGICCATSHWHGGPALLAVHQRKPRVIGLFSLPHLIEVAQLSLPKGKKLRKALGDFNDVAVHPHSGHMFVLSGRKGQVAELTRRWGKLQVERLWRVDTSGRDVPEGLGFDAQGRLWLVTDGRGTLRQLQLPAPSASH